MKELVIAGGKCRSIWYSENISLADGNSSETTVTSHGSGVVEKVGDSNTDKFNLNQNGMAFL